MLADAKKAPDKATVRSLIALYTKTLFDKYPGLFVLMLIAAAGVQIAELVAPLYYRDFFNTLAHGIPSDVVVHALFITLILIAVVSLISWGARRAQGMLIMRIEIQVMAQLYEVAFQYLFRHSQQFFSNQFTGTLTSRVGKFARGFETLCDSLILQFLPTFLFVAGAVGILFYRNHWLGLLLGVWAIGFTLLQVKLAQMRQPLRVAAAEEESRLTGVLADAISNQNTIELFSGVRYELSRLTKTLSGWTRSFERSWNADEYIWGVMGLSTLAIEIGLLWCAVLLWQKGLIGIGDFILIQSYLLTTFNRLVSINRDLRRFYDGIANASEMMVILNQTHEIKDLPEAKPIAVTNAIVDFTQVDFAFNTENTILEDFSLHIDGGKKYALVGPSGAGKSTVTKLLLRYYDVNAGSIQIDGKDIRTVTQESLREAIGYVPQEPILFHRTLMENIRYGRRDASDEEVIAAAKKAHAHEFISSFPQGYETYVGERGVKLSGGERQRVAIARAILKNAPLLILDEATSSLDSQSEHYIQEALDVLMQGKTVIVIAHRLSTIMKMDCIVVMENGAIVSSGTHDELLAEKGLYAQLWSIQAGGFLGGDEDEEEPDGPKEEPED